MADTPTKHLLNYLAIMNSYTHTVGLRSFDTRCKVFITVFLGFYLEKKTFLLGKRSST